MVAGAQCRGEFEERFQAVLKRCGLGADHHLHRRDARWWGPGPPRARRCLNMLKPLLARGELQWWVPLPLTVPQVRGEGRRARAPFPTGAGGRAHGANTIAILRGLRNAAIPTAYASRIRAGGSSGPLRYIADRFLPDRPSAWWTGRQPTAHRKLHAHRDRRGGARQLEIGCTPYKETDPASVERREALSRVGRTA